MNFYVPEIKDQIVLTEDWAFTLHAEERNSDLAMHFGWKYSWENNPNPPAGLTGNFLDVWTDIETLNISQTELQVTLPKGTILQIDRIYIRKGNKDFSSITFFAKNLGSVVRDNFMSTKKTNKKALRFWAKLEECNKIQYEKVC